MLLLNNNLPPAFLRHPLPPPFGPLFDTAQAMQAIRADAIAEHGRALDEKYRAQFAALERVLDKKYRDQNAARERALDGAYRSQYQREFRKKWKRSQRRTWSVSVLAVLLSGCVGWILATHLGGVQGARTMPPLAVPAGRADGRPANAAALPTSAEAGVAPDAAEATAIPGGAPAVAPTPAAESGPDAPFFPDVAPDDRQPVGDRVDLPAPAARSTQGELVPVRPVPRPAMDEPLLEGRQGTRDDIASVAHLRPDAGRHGLPRFAYLSPATSSAATMPLRELEAENDFPPASSDSMPAPPTLPPSYNGA